MIQSLWSDYDTVDWEKIQEQDFPNDNIPNYYGKEKVIRKPGKHILIVLWDFSVEIHWEMNLSHQLITV